MSLLGRKRNATADESPDTGDVAEPEADESVKTTAPKGRPTPKRDAARRRGPVAPAPMTAAEARQRRKTVAGRNLSKAERKEVKDAQRRRTAERREKMMAGEEDYLLPRDQGPVRRYIRDVVDSRYNLLGLFMPLAFVLIVVSFGSPPKIAATVSAAMMGVVVIMVIAGFFMGRKINKMVDEKFPKHTESGWRLGFYAASRASQIRRMRAPRPQVNRGEKVT